MRNTAGWIVTALRDGWDLTDRLAELRADQARRRRDDDAERQRQQQADAVRAEQQRADGWSAAVSAALDDGQLTRAIALVTTPMGGVGRRSVALACAQLRRWAAAHRRLPDVPLADALAAALDGGLVVPDAAADGPRHLHVGDREVHEPPASRHPPDLSGRVAAHLQRNGDRAPPARAAARTTPDEPHGRKPQ